MVDSSGSITGISYSDRVLRHRSEFDLVFKDNHFRVAVAGLYLMARSNSLGFARLGLVIPKKVLKHAVARNALKRRIRAYVRRQLGGYSIDCVVVATKDLKYTGKEDKLRAMQSFTPLVEEICSKLLRKLRSSS